MQLKDYLLDVITRYVMRQRVAKIPTDTASNEELSATSDKESPTRKERTSDDKGLRQQQ